MKTFFKRMAGVLVTLAVCTPAFCADWFVCMGSFRELANAQALQQVLADKGLRSFIYVHKLDSAYYNRVLLSLPFPSWEEARQKRDELADMDVAAGPAQDAKLFDSLGIDDLWVCQADLPDGSFPAESRGAPAGADASAPPASPASAGPADESPLSAERPYSVLVRTYRDGQTARHARDRLIRDGIDAFVMLRLGADGGTSYNVNAGALATREEAVSLQDSLREKGISRTNIAHTYFDDPPEEAGDGQLVIPAEPAAERGDVPAITRTLSAPVRDCLRAFPANEDFLTEAVVMYDFDTLTDINAMASLNTTVADYLHARSSANVYAAAYARYRDDLYDKSITVFVAEGAPHYFDSFMDDFVSTEAAPADGMPLTQVPLAIPGGALLGTIAPAPDGALLLLGAASPDGSLYIRMRAENCTEDELKAFLEASYPAE